MENKAQKILEELKQAHPNYEISTQPTNQHRKQLIIIKDSSKAGDIDDWSVKKIYPIWWNMLEILKKYENALANFRLLFINDNQFMLHSPDVGCGSVFREMTKPLYIDVYGDYEKRHYVGIAQNINDVLDYLSQTHIRF